MESFQLPAVLEASPQFRASGFNKTAGRVQILGGDLYYSPNSNQVVQLPAPHRRGSSPFSTSLLPTGKQSLWQLDTSQYEQPRWWGNHYGWIAFYHKNVADTSVLFRILRNWNVRFTSEDDVGYTLPHPQAEEFLRLDNQLDCACAALRNRYTLHGLPPRNPWAFGYLRSHAKPGILSLCIKKTKEWFVVWLAQLSYLIAASETREVSSGVHTSFARQNWRKVLVDECANVQIDQAWIDLLLDSSIASFSSHIPRTGAFVSLFPGVVLEEENSLQPKIEWFIEYGVPVWYRWDKEVASLPGTRHLAPLEFQLQQVDSFMRKSPTLPIVTTHASSVAAFIDDVPDRTQRSVSTAKMDAFFKLRDERTARLKEQETQQQRAVRLSQEKQPPTVKTRVFEWTANGDGEYVHEELMTSALRQEALDYYNGNQLRYNAVLNEWHVCELWDAFDDEDDEDPFGLFTFEGDDKRPPKTVSSSSYADNSLLDDVRTETETGTHTEHHEQQSRQALQLQEEIIHVATVYFGYTPPIPLPEVKPLEIEQQRKTFCRSFGLIWNQVTPVQDVFTFPAAASAIDFFQRLGMNGNILSDEWDLNNDNRQFVGNSPRLKHFRPVFLKKDCIGNRSSKKPVLYMLDLESMGVTPWKLAVKNASDALMICRLDLQFNEYNIVDFLLTNGIAFHTLQPSRTVLRTPNIPRPSLAPLTRVEGYKFGSHDYIAYRERCHAILNHPRGRAALLHGHFMWRIAFRSVMWEAVYSGPSGWSSNPDEMLVVEDASGVEFVDDKLSTAEQEALCGTYHCLTGNGDQFAIASWYMPPHLFEKSNLALGRWSSHTESLFSLLDRTFTGQGHSITRGPLRRSQWDDRARSSQNIRKSRLRLEVEAVKIFNTLDDCRQHAGM